MKAYLSLLSFILIFLPLSGQVEDTLQSNFKNQSLEGSLLVPRSENKLPLVIIIAGSGPTDRDGNNVQMKNNSLKMLAEGLAEKGIASFRFDKRGIGKSASESLMEKNMRFEHFVDDVIHWTQLIVSLNRFSHIFILGHSEGSLIGMLVSQQTKPAGFISLSGAGRPIAEVLGEQLRRQPLLDYERMYEILDSLESGNRVAIKNPSFNSIFRGSVQDYLISWMKYTPQVEIAKLKLPTLVLQGTLDMQAAEIDYQNLKKSVHSGEAYLIEGMNHVLKLCEDNYISNMKSYYDPELPISDELIEIVSRFVFENSLD